MLLSRLDFQPHSANERPSQSTAITMTTLAELESRMLVAVITEQNFQRAKSDLRYENLIKNGRGTLQDCVTFLSDDGKSVVAYANWHDDAATIYEVRAGAAND
jgi:hypothetical protein